MKRGIKVIRDGKIIAASPKRIAEDTSPTQIRPESAEKLKALEVTTRRIMSDPAEIKLSTKSPRELYSAGFVIKCDGCSRVNRSKRMYEYAFSTRGRIVLCERCNDDAEVRSFCKLDALDRPRKEIKID